jgi:hypothetical protein
MTQQLPPNFLVWRAMGIPMSRRMGQPFEAYSNSEAFIVLESWSIPRRSREDGSQYGRVSKYLERENF